MPTWYPNSIKCQARGKYEFCIVRFYISNPPPQYQQPNRRGHARLLCLCVSGSLLPVPWRALAPAARAHPSCPRAGARNQAPASW